MGGVHGAAFLAQRFAAADNRSETALEGDAGQDFMAAGQGGELTDLLAGDGGRFFDDQMAAVLDGGGAYVVEVVRWHDGVDGVGFFAFEHLAVVAIAAFDFVFVADFVQALFVELGDGDEFGLGDVAQGGVVRH